MSAEKVKPKLKPIDKAAEIYHHFEYSVSYFGLFDDADDGTPIVIGSRNLVDAVIRNLPKRVIIFYYKKNSKGYWEKKTGNTGTYNGKQEDNKQSVPQK
jgi:hypothetical protein